MSVRCRINRIPLTSIQFPPHAGPSPSRPLTKRGPEAFNGIGFLVEFGRRPRHASIMVPAGRGVVRGLNIIVCIDINVRRPKRIIRDEC